MTEYLLEQETYSKSDQKIWIAGDSEYEGPLAKYVDDWDAIFEYATGTEQPTSTTTTTGTQSVNGDTNIVEQAGTARIVS